MLVLTRSLMHSATSPNSIPPASAGQSQMPTPPFQDASPDFQPSPQSTEMKYLNPPQDFARHSEDASPEPFSATLRSRAATLRSRARQQAVVGVFQQPATPRPSSLIC